MNNYAVAMNNGSKYIVVYYVKGKYYARDFYDDFDSMAKAFHSSFMNFRLYYDASSNWTSEEVDKLHVFSDPFKG